MSKDQGGVRLFRLLTGGAISPEAAVSRPTHSHCGNSGGGVVNLAFPPEFSDGMPKAFCGRQYFLVSRRLALEQRSGASSVF
jgi:hypothetical protein